MKVKTTVYDAQTKEYKVEYVEQEDIPISEEPIENKQLAKEEIVDMMIKQNIQTLAADDNMALRMVTYYPTWKELCDSSYLAKTKGFKFSYGNKLYKTVQDSFTFQNQWVPGEGTSTIYTQIIESQAGTLEDPITVPSDVTTNAFTYTVGKYYKWNNQVYKCEGQGLQEGKEFSFVYSPDQLLGQYFTLIV